LLLFLFVARLIAKNQGTISPLEKKTPRRTQKIGLFVTVGTCGAPVFHNNQHKVEIRKPHVPIAWSHGQQPRGSLHKWVGGPHMVAKRKVSARGIARPNVTSVQCTASDCSGRTTVFEFPGRHIDFLTRKLGLDPRPVYTW